jgi:hypothetical protein
MGKREVQRYGVDAVQVWRVMSAARSPGAVRGNEPWPGCFLSPTSPWSPSPAERKDLTQKLVSDIFPRADATALVLPSSFDVYRRLSFGKEMIGSADSRSASARYVLVERSNRLWPVEVLYYFNLKVDKRSDTGNTRSYSLSFCKVRWFERKQAKGPEGRDSLYFTQHFVSNGWQQFIPIQRIVQRFAPAFSNDGFTFYACAIPRRVHL